MARIPENRRHTSSDLRQAPSHGWRVYSSRRESHGRLRPSTRQAGNSNPERLQQQYDVKRKDGHGSDLASRMETEWFRPVRSHSTVPACSVDKCDHRERQRETQHDLTYYEGLGCIHADLDNDET